MLRAENVTVRYGAQTVVNGLSFELRAGQWLMLVGPNGAGKSTLIEAIAQGVPYTRVAPAVPKSRLETLIERMKAIEARLPDPVETSAEEELAFTQAAQEQYDLAQYYHNRRFKGGRSTGGIHP